jgi:TolB-like protein/DNA-binding winged helix-turn-helix (wHTH) protein/Flp pilus assembly protein TadD
MRRAQTNGSFRFAGFELNPATAELRNNGRVLQLPEKTFRLLLVLLERAGEPVTREEIRERLWGTTTHVEFDDNLNHAVKRLREVLGDVPAKPLIETIPRRGYRFVAPVERAVEPRSFRRWHWAFAAIATGVAILFVLWNFQRQKPTPGPAPEFTIAVLPFTDLSSTRDQQYLCDGIAEELTTTLAREGLRVASRTLLSKYRENRPDLRQVARELKVHALVEGSVRSQNGRLRVTARLVEASMGYEVWTHARDFAAEDPLTIQREVASSIAREFHRELSGLKRALVRPHSANPEAYQYLLRGAYYWGKGDEESLAKAIEYYRLAASTDPGYALAWASLSHLLMWVGDMDWLPTRETHAEASRAAGRAVALDGSLAEAHCSLAWVKAFAEWDWSGAESEFLRAIELDPSDATIRSEYAGQLLRPLGREEEAATQLGKALALNPASNIFHVGLAAVRIQQRRYEDAFRILEESARLVSKSPARLVRHGRVLEEMGRCDEAIGYFQEGIKLSGSLWALSHLGYCYARLGRRAEAEQVIEQLKSPPPRRNVGEFEIAAIFAGLGEEDRAFEWLDRALARRSHAVPWAKVDFRMDPLRGKPRFQNLLEQMRLGSRSR